MTNQLLYFFNCLYCFYGHKLNCQSLSAAAGTGSCDRLLCQGKPIMINQLHKINRSNKKINETGCTQIPAAGQYTRLFKTRGTQDRILLGEFMLLFLNTVHIPCNWFINVFTFFSFLVMDCSCYSGEGRNRPMQNKSSIFLVKVAQILSETLSYLAGLYKNLPYTGCFKQSFKTLKEYTNLYRGHTQRFELS
jgi:hypothetical protein